MVRILVVFSSLGVVFFIVRLVAYPEAWLTQVIGVAACLVVLVRNVGLLRLNRGIAAPAERAASAETGAPAKTASAAVMHEVRDASTLEQALGSERAILYKHSTSCPVSAWVIDEVLEFARTHPDWTVYLLKVIEQRGLSDAVAERLGVRHESPQAFVIKAGRCVWNASHSTISADNLEKHAV